MPCHVLISWFLPVSDAVNGIVMKFKKSVGVRTLSDVYLTGCEMVSPDNCHEMSGGYAMQAR